MKVTNKTIIITDPCYICKNGETKFEDWKGLEGLNKNTPFTQYTESQRKAYTEYRKAKGKSDWERCECGQNMKILGLKHYLSEPTGIGDWSCKTYDSDTGKVLGNFCADSGSVGVFILDEVLQYNPDFDYHTKNPKTTTTIKNFTGDVEIKKENGETKVVGKGNINFYTK